MSPVLADTGPLYALVDRRDRHHERATRESQRLLAEDCTITVVTSTAMEAYTLIQRRLGIGTAQRWLRQARAGLAWVYATAEDLEAAGDLVLRFADQPITLFDATLAIVARETRLPVWTYDHHFDVMESAVWR